MQMKSKGNKQKSNKHVNNFVHKERSDKFCNCSTAYLDFLIYFELCNRYLYFTTFISYLSVIPSKKGERGPHRADSIQLAGSKDLLGRLKSMNQQAE